MYIFRGIALDDDIKESIDRYVKHGIPTGDFLRACIENNLSEAVARADEYCLPMIPAIVGYLYNEVDRRCWGHANACGEWVSRKRAEREGMERKEEDFSVQISPIGPCYPSERERE